MDINAFFATTPNPYQKQYEALRAHYVDGLSLKEVNQAFGFSITYLKKLRSESAQAIRKGKNPFFIQRKPGPKSRFTSKGVIQDVIDLRKQNHSIKDIQALLCAKGQSLSLSCIDNILKDEGFAPIPKNSPRKERDLIAKKSLLS